MRKIAIIKTSDHYNDYDDFSVIIQSITNWEEVTTEEFDLLTQASYRKGFRVIEQPIDPAKFVKQTVAEYIAEVEIEQLRAVEEKRLRDQKAMERRLKKDLKDKESKKELLAKLKAELGEV